MSGWPLWLSKRCLFLTHSAIMTASHLPRPWYSPWSSEGQAFYLVIFYHILLPRALRNFLCPCLTLIHNPQPRKVFSYKTFIKLWKKIFPYSFILSKTIEQSIFSQEDLITFPLKMPSLWQPQTSNVLWCITKSWKEHRT